MHTFLFDLGGVVVDYRGPERFAALSNGAVTLEAAQAALASPTLHAFERGQITPAEFAERMVSEWNAGVDAKTFIEDFETWPEAFLPGARGVIENLPRGLRRACLSNINIPHWRRAQALGVDQLFEHVFLSHELGRRKPEPGIFEEVVTALNCPPSEIVFFDDVEENVEAASRAGIIARHVKSPGQLQPVVAEMARLVEYTG